MFLLGKPDPWKLLKQKDLQGLLKALEHRDGDVRNGAAKALGLLGDSRGVEPLIAVLRDKDGDVRRSAAKSLGELGNSRAVEPLIAVLMSSDRYVHECAAIALGQLRDVRAAESLLRLVTMRQADTPAQWAAIAALEKLGDPSTIPALVAAVEPLIKVLVESGGGKDRRYAARTLGELVSVGKPP